MDSNPLPQIVIRSLHRGEPVSNLDMFTSAWDECVELQVTPKQEWIGRSLLALQSMDRHEILMFHGSRNTGGLVLAHDPWDVHVGPCLSVFAQYVHPEYRNAGVSPMLMREAVRIAKRGGYGVMAFTHRKGAWCYETLYRRIK